MKIINNNTIVVYSSSELKEILEGNNEYSLIYLGSNITLESGIKISSTKVNLTIDGTYEETKYTLTDKKSLASSDTISVSSPSILEVIVRNIDIVGYNYYGTIYVPENSLYKNTIIEYNNITYTGPQISFHPVGLTRFIDSNITISDSDLVVGNEVAECNKIELGGTTNILHKSKNNSAFWFRNSTPSLTILSNSYITFTSEYRELFYGVSNLNFSILNNSYFSLTSHSGMAYGNYGTGITTISPNSELIIKQTGTNGSYSTWQSYGSITLNENSSLTIINDYPGISSSNYNLKFSSDGALILNNPQKVILYNEKANVINTSTSIPFSFKFSRINLFNNTIKLDENISESTMPSYSWYKENNSSVIDGKFTATTCSIETHNYTEEELSSLPALNNFIFANKKIFSLGDFAFRVNAITDKDTTISGITKEQSSILISYDDINTVVVADSKGEFTYNYENPLPIGTILTFNIKKKNEPLYHTKVVQIIYSGELILDSATKIIEFKLIPINNNPILCPRNNELTVNVIDTRANSTNWKLYATINHKLTTIKEEEFNGSLVYKDNNNNITVLSDTPTLVYTGKSNDGESNTTNVTWKEDEGILLMINDKIINKKEYTANIIWTIEE